MKNIRANRPPCFKCTDRQAGCHSKCDRYIEYSNSREEVYNNRKSRVESDNYIVKTVEKTIKRCNSKRK